VYNNPIPRSSGPRIVSDASIADPEQDSAGGNQVFASNEKASDVFANFFMEYVIGWIWPDGITLDWVKGRIGPTTLNWNISYPPSPSPSLPHVGSLTNPGLRAQEASLALGKDRIAARTDGSLQIEVTDPNDSDTQLFWMRQYYVIPLEVRPGTRRKPTPARPCTLELVLVVACWPHCARCAR